MAILKHGTSKNANYGDALNYLLFEHDGFTMKPDEKRSELLDSLVDIRDVRIDRSQSVEERMK